MNPLAPVVAPERWLLTPVNLVPNGRAHLGHIGGPLLRMDALARHLRRRGDSVTVISASDVHETHVAVKAIQEGRTPEAVANDYHAQIDTDLKALDVRYDLFLNPLDPEWAEPYRRLNVALVDALAAAGATETRRETLYWGTQSQDWVLGGFLRGRCPDCGTPGVSFFCEACGAHFQPQEMVDPQARLDGEPLERREETCLFMVAPDPQALPRRYAAMGVRADFRAIAERYLAKSGGAIRLTMPGRWGVPYDVAGSASPQVIFTYSGVLFGCHLLCGEAWGQLTGTGLNAFDPAAAVRTVISFGMDNCTPFLVGVLGAGLFQSQFKPVDDFLFNYFYTLQGEKFSTNRRHVIWAADLVTRTPAQSDLIRAYLAAINPEFALADFDLDAFVGFYNRVASRLDQEVRSLRGRAAVEAIAPAPTSALTALLAEMIGRQNQAFTLNQFCFADAWAAVEAWLGRVDACVEADQGALWRLRALALLCAPITPRLAATLWAETGAESDPSLAEFWGPIALRPAADPARPVLGPAITRADLAPALPETLRSA